MGLHWAKIISDNHFLVFVIINLTFYLFVWSVAVYLAAFHLNNHNCKIIQRKAFASVKSDVLYKGVHIPVSQIAS